MAFRKANLKLEVTPQITPEGNVILDHEEYPRPDTTAEGLAQLKPAFEMFLDMPSAEGQKTYRQLKFAPFPVVGAPAGLAALLRLPYLSNAAAIEPTDTGAREILVRACGFVLDALIVMHPEDVAGSEKMGPYGLRLICGNPADSITVAALPDFNRAALLKANLLLKARANLNPAVPLSGAYLYMAASSACGR